MKLRNKKTGKIFDWREDLMPFGLGLPHPKSLAEFNEDWEDYKPVEPLIKDEKIRKAVRAWADVNGISDCVCKEEIHCITFETERGMFISFENVDSIPPEGNYTIEELCGEEGE